eukprot:CFRG7742T1
MMGRIATQPSSRGTKGRTTGLKEINRNLSKDEMLKRLKALLQHLQKHQQNDNLDDVEPFTQVLVSDALLRHKDKEVRVYVACCLADILRLYAPDAPYSEDIIVTVFKFFVTQLHGLSNQKSPLFTLIFSLLETLAFVESFVLCVDLPEATEVFTSLVSTLLETVSPSHSNKVVSHMADMMVGILREMDSIDAELLTIIFEPLLPQNKTSAPAQYYLSKLTVERADTNLQGDVTRFFRTTLENKASLGEVINSSNVYSLLEEISGIAPNTLLYVYPLLGTMLEVEYNESVSEETQQKRFQATRLLCRMFAQDSNMVISHNGLWESLLKRLHDIKPLIRVEVLKHCKQFACTQDRVMQDVIKQVVLRLLDPVESVRVEAVRMICETAMEHPTAFSQSVFEKIYDRCKDKKPEVREISLRHIGEVYKKILLPHATKAKDQWNTEARKLHEIYGGISQCVLRSYLINLPSTQRTVEFVLQTCFVDTRSSAKERGHMLLNLYSGLGDKGEGAFTLMLKNKLALIAMFRNYCDLRVGLTKSDDVEKTDSEGKDMLKAISLKLGGDVHGTLQKLLKVHRSKDLALFKLMTKTLSCTATPIRRKELVSETLTKTKEKDIIKSILSRTSLTFASSDLVPHLLDHVLSLADEVDTEQFATACKLVKLFGSLSPAYFGGTEVITGLAKLLKIDSKEIVEVGLQIFASLGDALHMDAFSSNLTSLKEELHTMAITSHPHQAKLAVKVLAASHPNPDQVFDEVLSILTSEERLCFESEYLLTTLASLGAIAVVAPLAFDAYSGPAISFVVQDLLQNNRTHSHEYDEDTDRQIESTRGDRECNAKVLGVKLLVKRLLGMETREALASEDDQAKAVESFKITNKLLRALIANKRFCEEPMSESDDGRLRLAGACGYLKLAACKVFKSLLPASQMDLLAHIMEDPIKHVREKFTRKLTNSLLSLKLDNNFMSLLCIAAIETDETLYESTRLAFAKIVEQKKAICQKLQEKNGASNMAVMHRFQPEFVLPTLLSLLAHRDDSSSEGDGLGDAERILKFCLDALTHHEKGGQVEHYDFLHAIVGHVKNCKDALRLDESEDLYTMCDLALMMIADYARRNNKNWVIQSFPSRIKLPHGFFAREKHTSPNAGSYLPEGFTLSGSKSTKQALIGTIGHKPRALKAPTVNAPEVESEPRVTKTKQLAKKTFQVAKKSANNASRRQAPRGVKSAIGTMRVASESESDGEDTTVSISTRARTQTKLPGTLDDSTINGNWKPDIPQQRSSSPSPSPLKSRSKALDKATVKNMKSTMLSSTPQPQSMSAAIGTSVGKDKRANAKPVSGLNHKPKNIAEIEEHALRETENEIDGDNTEMPVLYTPKRALYDSASEEEDIDINAPRKTRSSGSSVTESNPSSVKQSKVASKMREGVARNSVAVSGSKMVDGQNLAFKRGKKSKTAKAPSGTSTSTPISQTDCAHHIRRDKAVETGIRTEFEASNTQTQSPVRLQLQNESPYDFAEDDFGSPRATRKNKNKNVNDTRKSKNVNEDVAQASVPAKINASTKTPSSSAVKVIQTSKVHKVTRRGKKPVKGDSEVTKLSSETVQEEEEKGEHILRATRKRKAPALETRVQKRAVSRTTK